MNIALQRQTNQRILGEKFETPEEVVKWMGAIQAQDYHQSLWAIGLRLKSATKSQVEQAIADRKIVLTWPMRGTIHVVPSEDVKWMLKLLSPRILAQSERRMKQLELDQAILSRCMELFHQALQGNHRLTRPSMMDLLESEGISTASQRGYHILWHLSQTGNLCFGPMQDKQQTFVLLEEWVQNSRELPIEESLCELAGRFYYSHGPATIYDFAKWSGLTINEATIGTEAAKPNLTSEKVDGTEYWMPYDAISHQQQGNHDAFLLPGFDEYLIGYKDRSAVLSPDYAHLIVPGSNGIFLPTIVADGQVIGTWKRTLKKNSLQITLTTFEKLENLEEKAYKAAKSFSDFFELPISNIITEQ